MRIALDAKRAYFNSRGLGNYSRLIIRALSQNVSADDSLFLFSPQAKNPIAFEKGEAETVFPSGFWSRRFPAAWRTWFCVDDARRLGIDVFHGLSNELPVGLAKAGVPSVLTMHDVIFLKHPEWFPLADRYLFRKKYVSSCRRADVVVAISEGTRNDILEYIDVEPDRVKVVYQSCDPIFSQPVSDVAKSSVRQKYRLPQDFIVTVCAIEERKNHKCVINALSLMRNPVPYVIIGRKSAYMSELQNLVSELGLDKLVLFLHDVPTSDLPAVYSLASVVAYPSFYEGFGLPIVEAQSCHAPVVTSTGGCFAEVAGEGAIFADPKSPEDWADALSRILEDSDLRESCVANASLNVERFSERRMANELLGIYRQLCR